MKINKLIARLLAVATIAGVTSCSSGSSYDEWKDIDAFCINQGNDRRWSFYEPDGTVIYEEDFPMSSAICNGFFTTLEGSVHRFTVYRAGKNPEILGDLIGLKGAGYFSEDGLMPISREREGISVVNTKGETVFSLDSYKGSTIRKTDVAFSDGLLLVMTSDYLYGFVNTKGEMVIAPKFKEATTFKYGRSAVKMDGKFRIIDTKGETILKIKDSQWLLNATLSDKYLLVKDSDYRLSILDINGETVFKCPEKVKSVEAVNGDKFIFTDYDGGYGLMKINGEVLIRPKYESMSFVDNGRLLAKKEYEYWLCLDYSGEEIFKLKGYSEVKWKGKFGFLALERRRYVFLDKNGERINDTEIRWINTDPALRSYCEK